MLSLTGAIPFSRVAVQNRALSSIEEDRTMSFGQSPKSSSFKNDRRGTCSIHATSPMSYTPFQARIPPGSAIDERIRHWCRNLLSKGRRVPSMIFDLPKQYYEMMLSDAQVSSVQTRTCQICILQRDLTHKSSKRFAEDDFESHWTRCSVKER
jgi:hypothetical protein